MCAQRTISNDLKHVVRQMNMSDIVGRQIIQDMPHQKSERMPDDTVMLIIRHVRIQIAFDEQFRTHIGQLCRSTTYCMSDRTVKTNLG